MNEYMNHTQNNPKFPSSNANMPAPSLMPSAGAKSPAQMPYMSPLFPAKGGASMPGAQPMTSMPGMQPSAQPGGTSLSGAQPISQPAQFGTPSEMSAPLAPSAGMLQQGPPPVMGSDYIPGFLSSIIGRTIRAEFVIGTSQFVDRTGVLTEVGVNYFVLNDVNARQYVMCDLYSVRFVTILN